MVTMLAPFRPEYGDPHTSSSKAPIERVKIMKIMRLQSIFSRCLEPTKQSKLFSVSADALRARQTASCGKNTQETLNEMGKTRCQRHALWL